MPSELLSLSFQAYDPSKHTLYGMRTEPLWYSPLAPAACALNTAVLLSCRSPAGALAAVPGCVHGHPRAAVHQVAGKSRPESSPLLLLAVGGIGASAPLQQLWRGRITVLSWLFHVSSSC